MDITKLSVLSNTLSYEDNQKTFFLGFNLYAHVLPHSSLGTIYKLIDSAHFNYIYQSKLQRPMDLWNIIAQKLFGSFETWLHIGITQGAVVSVTPQRF